MSKPAFYLREILGGLNRKVLVDGVYVDAPAVVVAEPVADAPKKPRSVTAKRPREKQLKDIK